MPVNQRTRAVLFAALISAGAILLLETIGLLVKEVVMPVGPDAYRGAIKETLTAAAVLIISLRLIGRRGVGLVRPIGGPAVIIWVLPASLIALNLLKGSGFESMRAPIIAALFIKTMAIGVWEEAVYRGVLSRVLRVFANRTNVVIASAMFGVIHFREGWLAVVAAFVAGLALAVAFFVGRSLWPNILIHGLIDFFHNITVRDSVEMYPFIWSAVILAVFIIAIVVLMKHPIFRFKGGAVAADYHA